MKAVGSYAMEVTTRLGFDEAVARVRALLGEHGFGVLTEIDVQQTMKQKLDVDYRRYLILGACNPPLAHRVFTAEPHVGVLLPCNVVVWDEGDRRVVAALEPRVIGEIVANDEVRDAANQVSALLAKVLERVG